MSVLNEFTFISSDGETNIYVREFIPEREVLGTVQLVHGIAEYGERYYGFMKYLADKGFAVSINDALGHGRSQVTGKELFFAEENGWNLVVDDIKQLHDIQADKYPGVKRAIFGHSMGSFLTRTYIIKYPKDFDAAVICGTGNQSKLIVRLGLLMAKNECRKNGPLSRSKKLNGMTFSGYNKRIDPLRTHMDWLSVNKENVDKYIADPLCGGLSASALLKDMMTGILFIQEPSNLAKMNKHMPVFFIAGSEDPVGEYGRGVKKAYDSFISAGMKEADMKLYTGDRHEILNEDDKETVYEDVCKWISSKFGIS